VRRRQAANRSSLAETYSLDSAFGDILRGGFGTPVSREALGPELFDELVEIVRDHEPGGEQSGSRIEPRLE